ncbi:hypothetical protein ACIBCA_31665 [Kitasatospora sp. NPDC051170]
MNGLRGGRFVAAGEQEVGRAVDALGGSFIMDYTTRATTAVRNQE